MKFLCKILLILIFSLTTFAQTSYFNEDSTMAAFWNNRIYFPFDNNGILADVNVQPVGRVMRYDSIGVVFSGGFFLSGYSDTSLWANGVARGQLVKDYLPGNVGSLPGDSTNLIYSVLIGDPPFGQAWQNWRTAVEQGAYFYDGNNDGFYDPVDINGNNKWDTDEDKPDLLYDATFFTVYNDGLPASQRRYSSVDPIGIEIRQTIFISNQNSVLDDGVFIRYSLLYKGLGLPNEPDSLSDVIFSIWSDSDIGDAVDDLAGCDTVLSSGYIYQDDYNGHLDSQFGSNAPAVFKAIVQGPLIKSTDQNDEAYNKKGPSLGIDVFPGFTNGKISAFITYQGGDPDLREPNNSYEFRNYAMGFDILGHLADPCNWAYSDVVGGANCNDINPFIWYNGDPVTNYGWLNTIGTDQRDMASTSEFTLRKNEPMDIIVAYVVGRGTDALNSITRAREITQYVHEEYTRNFSTLVGVEDEPEEVVNTFSLSQNYPNPFNPTTSIEYTIPSVGRSAASPYNTKLIVYDILGRQVKILVNEMKSPGSYEVTFDASQLASGVYFYRLTSGGFMQTKKMMVLK